MGEFEGYDAFLPSRAQTGIGGLAERDSVEGGDAGGYPDLRDALG